MEYIDNYKEDGEIRNCAGDGRCTYTSRKELGFAYAKMLLNDNLNGQVYNLVGDPITQQELADLINKTYKTDLKYTPVSYEDYKKERVEELGDFIGNIIAGIYKGISDGANDVISDFEKVTGRAHLSTYEMINDFIKV